MSPSASLALAGVSLLLFGWSDQARAHHRMAGYMHFDNVRSAVGLPVSGVSPLCLGLTGLGAGEAFEDPPLGRFALHGAGATTSAQERPGELSAVVRDGRRRGGSGGDQRVDHCHLWLLLLLPLPDGDGGEQFDLGLRVLAAPGCLELPSPCTPPVLPMFALARAGKQQWG